MKIIPIIIAAVIPLCILTGCVSDEQRAENARNLRTAEINAANYVYEKYGFKPTIMDSEIETSIGLFGASFSSHAYIMMKYDGIDFVVYIDGASHNLNGTDNFQAEEISQAVKERIEETVGCEVDSINLSNHYYNFDFGDPDNRLLLYNTYFHATNLDELTAEEPFECVASFFGDKDISAFDESACQELFDNNTARIYSYIKDSPSESWYSREEELRGNWTYEEEYAIYLNEAIEYSHYGGKSVYEAFKPEVTSFDGVTYMNRDNIPFTVKKTVPHNARRWGGHGVSSDAVIISDAYSISHSGEKTEDIWIYIDRDTLPDRGGRCCIGSYCEEQGFEAGSMNMAYFTEEYMACRLDVPADADDFYWVILKD